MKNLTKYCWVAIIAVALILSNYSLAVVSHYYGLPNGFPIPLAWLLSIPFDGAALVAGDLTLRYARELGSNGSGPKIVVISLAVLSAWLNSQHANILHLGFPAHVAYACPPIIAIVLFELHSRFEYRRALSEAGRTVEPLPVFGIASWIFHFYGAIKAVWEITGHRLEYRTVQAIEIYEIEKPEVKEIEKSEVKEIEKLEVKEIVKPEREPEPEPERIPEPGPERISVPHIRTKADAVRAAYIALGANAASSDVAKYAADRGFTVTGAYARTIRSQDKSKGTHAALRSVPGAKA